MKLTLRQQQVLDYVKSFKFIAPTIRQIAEHFQLSPGTVQTHLQALKRKGYL